jgi:hypothetical protein
MDLSHQWGMMTARQRKDTTMTGTPAAISTTDELSRSIDLIVHALRDNEWGATDYIGTPLGTHGVTYGDEGEGEFATVGMVLGGSTPEPPVFAEIEDGTYGQLQAFRIYREDLA